MRPLSLFNGISPLCVPFGDPKGTEKVPATSDSARLAAVRRRFLYNGTRPHQSFLAPLEGSQYSTTFVGGGVPQRPVYAITKGRCRFPAPPSFLWKILKVSLPTFFSKKVGHSSSSAGSTCTRRVLYFSSSTPSMSTLWSLQFCINTKSPRRVASTPAGSCSGQAGCRPAFSHTCA